MNIRSVFTADSTFTAGSPPMMGPSGLTCGLICDLRGSLSLLILAFLRFRCTGSFLDSWQTTHFSRSSALDLFVQVWHNTKERSVIILRFVVFTELEEAHFVQFACKLQLIMILDIDEAWMSQNWIDRLRQSSFN